MCGVAMRLGAERRGWPSGRGSGEDVETGAGDLAGGERGGDGILINSPRAQLMIRTPSFILAMDSALMMPRVSGVSAMWRLAIRN